MSTPIRVCLVSPIPPPNGGIARWTQMIVRHAETRGDIELSLVNTALRWRSIHDMSALRRILAGVRQLLGSSRALCRVLARERPDIVHVNTSGQLGVLRDLSLLLIAKLFRVPFIYHLRFGRIPGIARRGSVEWRLLTLVMRHSSAVIPLDRQTEATITRHLPSTRLERIPNCIDFTELPPAAKGSEGPRTTLFVGWVVATKGIEELLSAWAEIDSPEWSLVIAGPYDEAYRNSLVDRLKPPPSVHFVGSLPHAEILELMAKADLFVLPSHTEGFPNAVLEAMALGKPIVSTDVGAVGEMLAQGCGTVIAPQNREQLVTALAKLMRDPDQRNRLGESARVRALSEYSLESTFHRYTDLWRRTAMRD